MKKIVVYETNGKRFDIESEAIAYEKLCKKINGIMAQLLPRTKEIEDGRDYNKHNLNTLRGCFKAFCLECAKVLPEWSEWFMQTISGEKHLSHIGRLLSDNSHNCPILYDAYFRFSCTNFDTGFEFQSPYWANRPEEFFEWHKKYINKTGE